MRKKRSQESKGSSRETFAKILLREVKEEMALCSNLMLNIERMAWERPSGDAWGMVETPNGVMHRVHMWVYEVQPHERVLVGAAWIVAEDAHRSGARRRKKNRQSSYSVFQSNADDFYRKEKI